MCNVRGSVRADSEVARSDGFLTAGTLSDFLVFVRTFLLCCGKVASFASILE